MITGSENKELLFVLIPVSANTAKYCGSVIHRVGQYTELYFGIRDDTAVVTNKIWQCHGFTFLSPVQDSVDSTGRPRGVSINPHWDLRSQSTTRTGSGAGSRST